MNITKKPRLIVSLAVGLALGTASTVTCAIFCGKHNEERLKLYNDFKSSASYENLKADYTQILDDLLKEQKITDTAHAEKMEELNSISFEKIVFNYCLTHDSETANLYQQYQKWHETTNELLAGAIFGIPVTVCAGYFAGSMLEKKAKDDEQKRRQIAFYGHDI